MNLVFKIFKCFKLTVPVNSTVENSKIQTKSAKFRKMTEDNTQFSAEYFLIVFKKFLCVEHPEMPSDLLHQLVFEKCG